MRLSSDIDAPLDDVDTRDKPGYDVDSVDRTTREASRLIEVAPQSFEANRRAMRLSSDIDAPLDDVDTRDKPGYDVDSVDRTTREATRLIEDAPQSFEANTVRAEALVDAGSPTEALVLAEAAVRLDPLRPEGFAARARALRALGQGVAALVDLDAVIARQAAAPAYDARGVLLSEAGRLGEARAAFSMALSLDPRFTRAHFGLAMLGDVAADQLAAMESLAAQPERLDEQQRLFLLYALVKAYDEAGDFARAFAAAQAGARMRRPRWSGDERAELLRLVRATPSAASATEGGDMSEAPIFVFGMPRSGTSLVEQILSSHPEVFALGETEVFAREAAGAADGRAHAAYLARWPQAARSARRVVDKSLGNVLEIDAIRRALPRAKLIHVRRSLLDCALSCFFCFFSDDMPFAPDLASIGRYYRGYDGLMASWRRALPQGVMHEVEYERLIADPEATARELIEYCGLGWDPACLNFHASPREVRTASLAQVRRPLYRSAVGRAQNYEAYLGPLREALGG
jgi:tetratricopeptide (TPR) repeat protein